MCSASEETATSTCSSMGSEMDGQGDPPGAAAAAAAATAAGLRKIQARQACCAAHWIYLAYKGTERTKDNFFTHAHCAGAPVRASAVRGLRDGRDARGTAAYT